MSCKEWPGNPGNQDCPGSRDSPRKPGQPLEAGTAPGSREGTPERLDKCRKAGRQQADRQVRLGETGAAGEDEQEYAAGYECGNCRGFAEEPGHDGVRNLRVRTGVFGICRSEPARRGCDKGRGLRSVAGKPDPENLRDTLRDAECHRASESGGRDICEAGSEVPGAV